MAIFTFHFDKVFSTTQSLEIHFFLFQTRDFRFLLSRQEVSESGKKQQRRLRCTKPRALIGIHGGGAGYVLAGGPRLLGVGLGGGGGGGDGGDGRLLQFTLVWSDCSVLCSTVLCSVAQLQRKGKKRPLGDSSSTLTQEGWSSRYTLDEKSKIYLTLPFITNESFKIQKISQEIIFDRKIINCKCAKQNSYKSNYISILEKIMQIEILKYLLLKQTPPNEFEVFSDSVFRRERATRTPQRLSSKRQAGRRLLLLLPKLSHKIQPLANQVSNIKPSLASVM